MRFRLPSIPNWHIRETFYGFLPGKVLYGSNWSWWVITWHTRVRGSPVRQHYLVHLISEVEQDWLNCLVNDANVQASATLSEVATKEVNNKNGQETEKTGRGRTLCSVLQSGCTLCCFQWWSTPSVDLCSVSDKATSRWCEEHWGRPAVLLTVWHSDSVGWGGIAMRRV